MATNGFPDDALVVRGGECKPRDMRKNAETHEAKYPGVFALSAFCVPGLDANETARHAREQGEFYMRQASMREIPVGRLRADGFSVVPDEPPPGHVAIILSSPLTDTELEKLSGIFGPIVENPVGIP